MSDRRTARPWALPLHWIHVLGQSTWALRVGRAVALVLVGLSLYYVGRNLVPAVSELRFLDPGEAAAPLGLAFVTAMACTLLAGLVWRLLLSAAGYSIPWPEAVWLQVSSNLVKYLPGGPWQLVGKAYLTERRGVPLSVVSFVTLLEAACWVVTGMVVALAFVPSAPDLPLAARLRWPLLGLGAAALMLIPYLSARWAAYASGHGLAWGAVRVQPLGFWLSCLGMGAHWLLMGSAFWLIVNALPSGEVVRWGHAVSALALSSVAGLIVLLAPGGIGVREAALTYSLGGTLLATTASLAAVASRVLFVLAEVTAYLLISAARICVTCLARRAPS